MSSSLLPKNHRLAVLLATAPGESFLPAPPRSDAAEHRPAPDIARTDDFAPVQAALLSAIERGEDAALFLMGDGVRYATDPRLPPLLTDGVEVTLCAMDAESHGLDLPALAAAGIQLGSQHDHARLLRDSERFLSFT